jgi:hypothetical protein
LDHYTPLAALRHQFVAELFLGSVQWDEKQQQMRQWQRERDDHSEDQIDKTDNPMFVDDDAGNNLDIRDEFQKNGYAENGWVQNGQYGDLEDEDIRKCKEVNTSGSDALNTNTEECRNQVDVFDNRSLDCCDVILGTLRVDRLDNIHMNALSVILAYSSPLHLVDHCHRHLLSPAWVGLPTLDWFIFDVLMKIDSRIHFMGGLMI